jgi:predicted SAM-dependent methyltransferase
MRKIQFGSGGTNCFIDGWENTDINQVDIRNPLPYADNSVDFIMAEHVTQHDAYMFFLECCRVLKPGGTARIIVPDIKRIYENCDENYRGFVRWWWPGEQQWYYPKYWAFKERNRSKDNLTSAVIAEQMIFNFAHVSFWTPEILMVALNMAGFKTEIKEYGKSDIPELNNIDKHGIAIGLEATIMESTVVEATKL